MDIKPREKDKEKSLISLEGVDRSQGLLFLPLAHVERNLRLDS